MTTYRKITDSVLNSSKTRSLISALCSSTNAWTTGSVGQTTRAAASVECCYMGVKDVNTSAAKAAADTFSFTVYSQMHASPGAGGSTSARDPGHPEVIQQEQISCLQMVVGVTPVMAMQYYALRVCIPDLGRWNQT